MVVMQCRADKPQVRSHTMSTAGIPHVNPPNHSRRQQKLSAKHPVHHSHLAREIVFHRRRNRPRTRLALSVHRFYPDGSCPWLEQKDEPTSPPSVTLRHEATL